MNYTPDIARTVAGIIGNIVACFLFLSPLPTFVEICKKGSVEQYSVAPYLATLGNCMVWVLYGLPMVHPDNLLVLTIDSLGCVIEFIYVALFFFYSDRRRRLKVSLCLLVELIFTAALILVTLNLVHTFKKRSAIVGSTCVLLNIVMYASPLAVMKLVISTKSVEYMPFSLSFVTFANSVAWTIYSLIHFDPFIFIPSGLGILFSVVQLILYAIYYKSTKQQILAREGKGEMDVSEVMVAIDNGNGENQRPHQQD